ncbi:MAG: Arc family DNA-binding protein [Salipiger marinus]|uniref:Arc family DNA-binding protein n=1 Tax=Salipiger marinus TaxID=555512 RepID=UPI004058516D
MGEDYPSRKMDQFVVRLPDGMRDRIKAAAEANNRSMNSEVVAALEEKFPAPLAIPPDIVTLTQYLNLIDSAESDEERDQFLRVANESLARDPATSGFAIRLTTGPEGLPELHVARLKA